MSDKLKKVYFPANAPSPHKEMTKRVKHEFTKYRNTIDADYLALERNVLAILKEYDISDAMRSFEGKGE